MVRNVQEEDREFLYEMLKNMKIKSESASSVLVVLDLFLNLVSRL